MAENTAVRAVLERNVAQNRIAGAAIRIRKDGRLLCDTHCGYADIKNGIKVDEHTIFRLASMTKPVIASAILLLEEQGRLSIEEAVEKYLPEFQNMRVSDRLIGLEKFYEADPDNPLLPRSGADSWESVREVPAKRPLTIRDILSHSSGIGHGTVSMNRYEAQIRKGQTLRERVSILAHTILDFQPGEYTGYSAVAAYEILGRIIEIVSGMELSAFVDENICGPLGIKDLGYRMTEEQRSRIPRLYESKDEKLTDVTDSEVLWRQVNPLTYGYCSGSAGMLGSVEAYDRFVQTIFSKGMVNGKQQFLRTETVEKMHHVGAVRTLEVQPGAEWGLGVLVVKEPGKNRRKVGKGTFGWSGAYGTHFYIDPQNRLTVVLGVNCANIGGADSLLSREIEETVWREYCEPVP